MQAEPQASHGRRNEQLCFTHLCPSLRTASKAGHAGLLQQQGDSYQNTDWRLHLKMHLQELKSAKNWQKTNKQTVAKPLPISHGPWEEDGKTSAYHAAYFQVVSQLFYCPVHFQVFGGEQLLKNNSQGLNVLGTTVYICIPSPLKSTSEEKNLKP